MSNGSKELGGFLRSRRERLTPEVAGIAPGGTRRAVPGLRREELAELAGVSASYYTRLEQGASSSASDAVIDALAAALRLDPVEHEHLRNLAAPRRAARPRSRRTKLRPAVRDLLAAMSAVPAVVIDHRAEVLAWNRLGHALLAGHVAFEAPDERTRPNIARMLFLDPHHRALYRDWADKASVTVAALHQAVARHRDDPVLEQLVGRLAVESPEFARMWAKRPVRTCSYYVRELDHPVVGRLTLANETVTLPEDDQQLGLFYALPGTPDADALALLTRSFAEPVTKENVR
ncbi:helix-turn-helix domain-containing protein [Amycolatopsis rubida]|uniref:Helix-turn-helix domain-containing protein n=1 Tax=Amycolatopsis rubida TaxID=112413 RepID=A0ABX0BSR8_9PSEU|nr:helix-turn-helix transcriptional regulator [Amycolatopsis sp. M39]MYW93603.1 helix-turn-helix domain-containing protein [Amycolatopsis rubida]NEC58590.1 helix-turn-helix domain-containing protein [Amycolatopsis rubida]OAP22679.1 helix-turn-helix protein [Amycolatopsis sp. M39]